MTSVPDNLPIPTKDFALFQNYPNPFNPETVIKYSLAKKAFIELKIFNQAGQLIRTLKNETQQPGNYSVIWDGKNDSGIDIVSGIYFCQLRAGNFSESAKMIKLR